MVIRRLLPPPVLVESGAVVVVFVRFKLVMDVPVTLWIVDNKEELLFIMLVLIVFGIDKDIEVFVVGVDTKGLMALLLLLVAAVLLNDDTDSNGAENGKFIIGE